MRRKLGKRANCSGKLTERVALIVEYCGIAFHGWQTQGALTATVQQSLERGLSEVASSEIRVVCAGRTDAGVHATKQVVHFDTPVSRSCRAWVRGTNAHLPDGVAVQTATPVSNRFHARFSARWRRYRYLIHNSAIRGGLMQGLITRHHRPLEEHLMHMAGQALLGEQDFTSVRAAQCQSKTPMRNVMRCAVTRHGDLVVIDVVANAFLLHMVRNIAGVLMDIGAGVRPVVWMRELLDARDRSIGCKTAAPDGLYLIDVGYPASSGIEAGPRLPHLLSVAA